MRHRLGARHDAVVITQSALRPTGASSHAARRPSVVPTVLRLLAAPIVGGAMGVVLGYWCQRVAGTGGVAGTLAELGAPWILAAFVAGALPMIAADRRPRAQPGAGVVGALAGATSLVVATVVYYGPARTGRLDVPDARGITAMWAVVGIAVGVVIGAAGALWRSAPNAAQAVGCLVVAGTAVAAEAYYLLDTGDTGARSVLVVLAAVGIGLPLLAGRRWAAPVGMVLVAMLAVPGSLVAEVVWRGSAEGVALLQRR